MSLGRAGGDPVAVITDQHMGGMSGLELLAQLEELLPTALKVLHTGEARVEVELRRGSALTLLAKPVDLPVLRRLVLAAVAGRATATP